MAHWKYDDSRRQAACLECVAHFLWVFLPLTAVFGQGKTALTAKDRKARCLEIRAAVEIRRCSDIPFGTPVVDADDVFTLFTYGALDGVAEGTITSTFSINYLGDSNKWITQAAAITASDGVISLTGIEYIPEPASLALLGIGALLIAGRRRRG